MSSASRAARRARSRRAERNKSILLIIGGTVVALFALAALLTRSPEAPSSSRLRETSAVSVSGAPLPAFQTTERDPAVGMKTPVITGHNFSGREVAIRRDGRPKVVMFLAHWCPHCQREVPVVRDWLAQDGRPLGVDFYSIATATNPAQPNYPPSQWLARENWPVPVIADDKSYSAGQAAGVSSYPFFVFVNADGTVAARAAGELSPETLASAIAQLEH